MNRLLLSLLVLLAFACRDEEATPAEFLLNPDMETGNADPHLWWRAYDPAYPHEWTEEEAQSPGKSLKISCTQPQSERFSFWAQTITGQLPVGKNATLTVSIKAKELSGQGLSIVIRGDDTSYPDGSAEQFVTTQSSGIRGTFDWTQYQVRLTGIEDHIRSITVYLVFLPNTTGTAYFDDASLIIQ